MGNCSRDPIPISGHLSEPEEKHLRLRIKQLIYGILNGMRIRQALPQPYVPWTRTQVPQKAQQLRAGVQGLWNNLMARAAAVKRWTVGMSGRRLWWAMHVEEKRSHGSQMILLRTITIASLSPRMPASAAEQKKGWVIKCLMLDELQSKTPPRVLL